MIVVCIAFIWLHVCAGKWHGAPVAVKVMRLPLRVQQHADGVQPTPVMPVGRHIAHPNLVSYSHPLISSSPDQGGAFWLSFKNSTISVGRTLKCCVPEQACGHKKS